MSPTVGPLPHLLGTVEPLRAATGSRMRRHGQHAGCAPGTPPGASLPAGPRRSTGTGPPGGVLGSPPHARPDQEGKTRTRAHLTLALSTPIPKLMVATITGTFSSIHSFCTSVLSEAFSPVQEGKVETGIHLSLGFPSGSVLGLTLCWALHTLPNSSLTSCVALGQPPHL